MVFPRHFRARLASPVVAGLGIALALGCASEAANPERGVAVVVPDATSTAVVRADMHAIVDAAKGFADVPSSSDPKGARYFQNAARLKERQEELDVARAVEADFEALARDNQALGDLGIEAPNLEVELAHAKAERIAKEREIEDVLNRATAEGLSLREASGRPIDAAHVLRARFWRDVSARASRYVEANGSSDAQATPAERRFVEEVRAAETFDSHEVVESGQVRAILAGTETKGSSR